MHKQCTLRSQLAITRILLIVVVFMLAASTAAAGAGGGAAGASSATAAAAAAATVSPPTKGRRTKTQIRATGANDTDEEWRIASPVSSPDSSLDNATTAPSAKAAK
jgi:hypothetical protein